MGAVSSRDRTHHFHELSPNISDLALTKNKTSSSKCDNSPSRKVAEASLLALSQHQITDQSLISSPERQAIFTKESDEKLH